MGRPRKDLSTPSATDRITIAFWELLEDNQLNEISIGTIVSKAGCNRGTFYYHYADIDDLLYSVIESELLGDKALPGTIFNVVSGLYPDNKVLFSAEMKDRVKRLCLLMDKGGMGIVDTKFKRVVVDMWQAVLYPDGTDFDTETRLIIEYGVSGILGLISYQNKLGEQEYDTEYFSSFLEEVGRFMIEKISDARQQPETEILARLQMVERFNNIPHTRSKVS